LTGHVAFVAGDITGANYVTASFLTFISGGASDTSTLTVSGIISGEGDLYIGSNSRTGGGAGSLVLNAANTYAGNTLINASTSSNSRIRLGVTNALPTTTNVIFGSLSGAGNTTLDLFGNNQQIASLSDDAAKPITRNLTITNTSTTTDSTLTISGSVTPGNAFAGLITDGSTNKILLVKAGTNTLRLTGASTYTGGTTINGGELRVNNATGSGTGSYSVTVNSTGTLSGTGTIIMTSGALAVNAGGTVRGGFAGGSAIERTGTLNIDNIADTTIAAATGGNGATIAIGTDWQSANVANASLLNLIGTGNFLDFTNVDGSLGQTFNINVDVSTLVLGETYTIKVAEIADSAGSGNNSGVKINGVFIDVSTIDTSIATNQYSLSATGGPLTVGSSNLFVMMSDGDLYLTFTATPEPHHVLLVCVAALILGFWIRNRRIAVAA